MVTVMCTLEIRSQEHSMKTAEDAEDAEDLEEVMKTTEDARTAENLEIRDFEI